MPLEARPSQPGQHLLDEARSDLESRLSQDLSGASWAIGERMDRKRSTLFPLTLVSSSGEPVATAYYKASYYPADQQDSRHLERARHALAGAKTLGDRFAELVADSDIAINVTLAANLETLETVTLGLDGPPMGSPLRLMTSPARRREALAACRRVGEAVRILEEMGPAGAVDAPGEVGESSERKLGSASSFLSRHELEDLESALDELFAEATRAHGMALAHGDLSPGNVILMEGQTGLIDFLWIPQVRGFDLSRFVHRLRHTTTAIRPWTETLVSATLEGYGTASVTDSPGWRFSELMHLLTTLRRLDRRGRLGGRAGRRALAELRTELER